MNNDWRDYELYHYGIAGQKWGVRNYQNPDGTLTEEGRLRYQAYKATEKRKASEYYDRVHYEGQKRVDGFQKVNKRISKLEEKKLYGDTSERTNKKLEAAKKEREALNIAKKAAMKDIDSLRYEDMKKEISHARKTVATNIAIAAAANIITLPLGFYTMPGPMDVTGVKIDYRKSHKNS